VGVSSGRPRPNRHAYLAKDFPETLVTSGGDESLNYQLDGSRLEVFADLDKHLTVLEGAKKLGVNWHDVRAATHGLVRFYLRMVIAFTPTPARSSDVTWEHDVLPFLPGG
jgi:hypothetical protein